MKIEVTIDDLTMTEAQREFWSVAEDNFAVVTVSMSLYGAPHRSETLASGLIAQSGRQYMIGDRSNLTISSNGVAALSHGM